MRPTETEISKAKDFRTAMKQWISRDGLPVAGETRRRATVAQWKTFYAMAASDVAAACNWLNADVLGADLVQPETKPAAPAAEKPIKQETKPTETKPMATAATTATATTATATPAAAADLGAQLAAIMAQLAQGAGVNKAEVEKIVDGRLAAAGAVKHEFVLDGVRVGTVDGGHPVCVDVIDWLALKVPVYTYGEAGSGKSSIGRHAAEALNMPCYQYGSIFSKYELIGLLDGNGNYHSTDFRKWYENGGVLVLDEIDGSDPRAIVAFNDALRGPEGTPFSFPDKTVYKHADCVLIVSANTIGKGASARYVGRYKLDAASLNGFVHVHVDYDPKIERALSRGDQDWLDLCRDTRKAIADLNIEHIISPRQIDFGSRLLTSKKEDRKALLRRCATQVLRGGLSNDQWKLITSKVPALASLGV